MPKDNNVVAFLRYGISKKNCSSLYGEIYVQYVVEEYKDLGIGKSLVDYIIKLLKKNFKRILVSTLKENQKLGLMLSIIL